MKLNNAMGKIKVALASLIVMASGANAFDDPKEMLEVTTSEILKEIELRGDEFKQDRNKLYAFVETEILPHVEIEYVSKLILATNWKKASPEQRAAFQHEFSSFLVKNYASGLFAYDGQEVSFGDPQYNDDQSKAIVKAKMKSENGDVVGEFKLIKSDTGWKLYNAEVEAINLIQNFRSSYNDIIAQRGLDNLIAELKAKNDEYK